MIETTPRICLLACLFITNYVEHALGVRENANAVWLTPSDHHLKDVYKQSVCVLPQLHTGLA